jgi:pilus assembly protein Flp/PilA
MCRSSARAFYSDEDGATAAEYAVMLVLIICAVIASITAVGNSTADGWSKNTSKIQSACTGT